MSRSAPSRSAPSRCSALTRRAGAVGVLVLLAVGGLAGPASAHVTVGSDDSQQGASDAVLNFRVPNEQDSATTVKVAITFPKDTPLASVKPAPMNGWTVTTTPVTFSPPITTDDGTITTGVGEVVYRASTPSAAIPVGGFEDFQILVGPLPDKATSLVFPTLQTYSNGKVVSWVQPVTDPANPPDYPTPILTLHPAASTAGSASAAGSSTASASDVSGARTLAVVALVVAVLGLGVGGVGAARGRRRT